MVCLAEKPSKRLAVCCKLEVVKGLGGCFLVCFFSKLATIYWAPFNSVKILAACSSFLRCSLSITWLLILLRRAVNGSCCLLASVAVIPQYSSIINFLISRSRSTIKRTATDCTRPADKPLATFFQRKGESS